MKKISGFTLTEVIIVIVIVGILSLISVPIYRDHVQKSVAVEGQALLSEIMATQEIYNARNKVWYSASTTDAVTSASFVPEIGIDARRNKYFNHFSWRSIEATNDDDVSFSITTEGITGTKADGVSLTLNYYKGKAYEIIQNSGN
ncbi:MAG: prepilin-type N-terminal cleavage/methylation domain-containing protein [Endomicrobium sp.]|jgi:prepilin-type N-terminal cleavage/methylation domain-containing protein|nr:prepilin-type N-terminal cleavage/methylation domain-containing protein [Endomicrobium sp.]